MIRSRFGAVSSRTRRSRRIGFGVIAGVLASLLSLPVGASAASGEELDFTDRDTIVANAPTTPFDYGAYPIEDPWLSDLIGLRAAHGLDSSRELTTELMSRPGAVAQVSQYGVVLTEAEEDHYERRQAAVSIELSLMELLSDEPYFAGSQVIPDASPYELIIRVTPPGLVTAQESVDQLAGAHTDTIRVTVEVEDYSISELHEVAMHLNGSREGAEPGSVWPQEIAGALDEFMTVHHPELLGARFGFSMRHNAVRAIVRHESSYEDGEIIDTADGLPSILVNTVASEEDHHPGHFGSAPSDQGPTSCGRWWCGSPRGGHHVE